MTSAPVFGLQFIRQDDGSIPIMGANLDVVGIIGPCSTAKADKFPLDTPMLRYSNDAHLGSDLGSDGYLMDAVNAINAQLADNQIAAQLVIVRTDYGSAGDAALKLQQTIAKIMGNSSLKTGVWAFTKAPETLYCTPRLLCAPGYTGQMADSLDTLETDDEGVGYVPYASYVITFTPGNGESATAIMPIAHVVADANGDIVDSGIVIDSFGAWITKTPTASIVAPDGPPVTELPASGSIIFNQNPGIGSTVTFNTTVVTFVAAGASGASGATGSTGMWFNNNVYVGANLNDTLLNLMDYFDHSTEANITACTFSRTGGTVLIVNDTAGDSGNSYILETTVTGASLSGATLTGGRDAEQSTQATFTVDIALGANPVCAAMAGGLLNGLMAHAVVESAGTSQVLDEAWRSTLNSQRLIGLSGGVKILDSDGSAIITMPLAPRVIGAIVARDFATGYPFHSAANQPIQGIVAPGRSIGFSLLDGATEGQQLLAANIGVVVRGLVGIETAISSGGFVFIGTDNLGDDETWRFYNVTRGRDFIELSLMPGLRTHLGRSNIDRQTVMKVLGTIKDYLSTLQGLQQIIGFRVGFKGSENTANEIRLGHIVVDMAVEEPPVLRRITTMSARYKPAIDVLVAQLEAQLP